nr:type IV pilus assembly protein PilM [Legionella maioricensis]
MGIDIGSSSVKILEISGSGEELCVEGYGRDWLPPNALDGNVIKDIEAVTNCIKKLIVKAGLTCKQVALAVPDSAVISKVIQINDGLNDEEMEELVIIEADKFIPYPIDEINLDFEILGHSAKNSAMLDILIVASRAENVNSRVEAVSRAGLTVKVVDVESYAVERAAQQFAKDLPAGGQDKIVAIIDIGARFSYLFVLRGMKLIFSREEMFGSLQLIDAIAEHYHMTQQQALDARAQGTLPDDYDSEVLTPFKETLLLQIKRTLQFFYSTSQHGFVDHILLAGGIARQSALDTLIQEQLGVITTVANPLSRMSFNEKVNLEAITKDAPSLMVACGLALRNVE